MYFKISLDFLDFYVCFLFTNVFFLIQSLVNSVKRSLWILKGCKTVPGSYRKSYKYKPKLQQAPVLCNLGEVYLDKEWHWPMITIGTHTSIILMEFSLLFSKWCGEERVKIVWVTLIASLHIEDTLSVLQRETTLCHFHALNYFWYLRIMLRIYSKEICARNKQKIFVV